MNSFTLVEAIPMMSVFIVICVLPITIISSFVSNNNKKKVQELLEEIELLEKKQKEYYDNLEKEKDMIFRAKY